MRGKAKEERMEWYYWLMIGFIVLASVLIFADMLQKKYAAFMGDVVSLVEDQYGGQPTVTEGRIILPGENAGAEAPEKTSNNALLIEEFIGLVQYLKDNNITSSAVRSETDRIERWIKKRSGADYSLGSLFFILKDRNGAMVGCLLRGDPIDIHLTDSGWLKYGSKRFEKYSQVCFSVLPKLNQALREVVNAHKAAEEMCERNISYCDGKPYGWAKDVMVHKSYTEVMSSIPAWVTITLFFGLMSILGFLTMKR